MGRYNPLIFKLHRTAVPTDTTVSAKPCEDPQHRPKIDGVAIPAISAITAQAIAIDPMRKRTRSRDVAGTADLSPSASPAIATVTTDTRISDE